MSKNIFSNESFADWCERQGDRIYNYSDIDNCAACQYLRSLGLPLYSVNSYFWRDVDGNEHPLPQDWVNALNYDPLTYYHKALRPFKGLAEKLRAVAHAI